MGLGFLAAEKVHSTQMKFTESVHFSAEN